MLGFFFGGAPSSGELMLVFLAVLLLFGAKRLPNIARNMGKALEEFRRAARDVTDEIMHAADDAKSPPPPRTLPRREVVDEAEPDQPEDGGADEGPAPDDQNAEHDRPHSPA